MYQSAGELAEKAVEQHTICIIGGGAAGIVMAKELNRTPGVQVIVLESGEFHDMDHPRKELQDIYGGSTVGLMSRVNPQFLVNSRLRMYGGTTNHWGFWARPLDAVDLVERSGYHPLGWPFGREVLDQTYPRANELGAYDVFKYDDAEYWTQRTGTAAFTTPGSAPLKNVVFHAQYDKYINHFQLRYRDELRASKNVKVLFNCNVLGIEANPERSAVRQLNCAAIENGRPGKKFTVRADTYVLATGGLEATRLLLLSGELGNNAAGDLGRHFMVHPLIRDAARATFERPFDFKIESFYRGVATDVERAALGMPKEPFEMQVYDARFEGEPATSFTVWGALAPKPELVAEKRIGNFRLNLGFSGPVVQVNANWEQMDQRESRVTLDPTVRDPVFDQPVLRLDWRLAPIDKATVVEAMNLCKSHFERIAGNRLEDFTIVTDLSGGPDNWTFDPTGVNDRALWPGDHHMGLVRMSRRPEDGIVDPDLKVHTVGNLYVASCAVFPTAGYANPSLTLVALAIRLADHLKKKLA